MVKTLVVDDSPLIRTILKDFLTDSGFFEIIGEAENGEEGVKMVQELSPELITMDIEMPIMNGLDAIVEIRKFSDCGIVVISTHDTAKMAYEATIKGAHEFYSKDAFVSKMSEFQQEEIYKTLIQIAKIRKPNLFQLAPKQDSGAHQKIEAVVIAASTGGPMALCQLCSNLPSSFAAPIIVVQHNTSGFDRGFAQWLNEYSHLHVQLAEEGQMLSKGNIYIAPTEKHILISSDNKILFDDGEPVNNLKPSADMLFKSAAEVYKDRLASVVFTGMGTDGAEGTRSVKQAGGVTIAQDEASSMINGMPLAAAETGCVDHILPLNEIAKKLEALTSGS